MRRKGHRAVSRLLSWFSREKRNLPWRINRTPYRVWISEIMLQQTVVPAVVPRFESWMKKYPDVGSLASAAEDEVLREWEGLGYYNRARNILAAARLIVSRHRGRVPRDADSLRSLPGIGSYTSAAIRSIAYNESVALIDANVRRIVCRVLGWKLWDREKEQEAMGYLAGLLPEGRAAEFNEALMELGQTLCAPRETHCADCPLDEVCLSKRRGDPVLLKNKRMKVRRSESAVAVVFHEGRVRMSRARTGLFRDLWLLPRFPGRTLPEGRFKVLSVLKPVRHAYTFNIELLHPFLVSVRSGRTKGLGIQVPSHDYDRKAMPSAHRRILREAVQAMRALSSSEK